MIQIKLFQSQYVFSIVLVCFSFEICNKTYVLKMSIIKGLLQIFREGGGLTFSTCLRL